MGTALHSCALLRPRHYNLPGFQSAGRGVPERDRSTIGGGGGVSMGDLQSSGARGVSISPDITTPSCHAIGGRGRGPTKGSPRRSLILPAPERGAGLSQHLWLHRQEARPVRLVLSRQPAESSGVPVSTLRLPSQRGSQCRTQPSGAVGPPCGPGDRGHCPARGVPLGDLTDPCTRYRGGPACLVIYISPLIYNLHSGYRSG